MWVFRFLLSCICCFLSLSTWAQLSTNETRYKSPADDLATIHSIAALPILDNVGGIYSKPLEEHLIETIDRDHRFNLNRDQSVAAVVTPEELEENSEMATSISQSLRADAFIATRITKGPQGLSIIMGLFLTADAKLFAKAELKGSAKFAIDDLKPEVSKLYGELRSRVPYNGTVMSRDGQRVTINLGKRDGVATEQELTAIQIIKLNRHPKFHFLINTEKQILGRLKVIKAEDSLSFAQIITEVEAGAIQTGAKIVGLQPATYKADPFLLGNNNNPAAQLGERAEGKGVFGENPKEWKPETPPNFGEVSARLGIGGFSSNLSLQSEDLTADSSFYPSLFVNAELWITEEWSAHVNLRQSIISVSNPQSGSPDELAVNVTEVGLSAGYNFYLGGLADDPRIEVLAGWSNASFYFDSTSSEGFPSVTYSGLRLGAKGDFPLGPDKSWRAGLEFHLYLFTNLSESPFTGGSDDSSTINQIRIFGSKKINHRLRYIGALDFDLYSSDYKGTGTRSTQANSLSIRSTVLSGGLSYQF